MANSNLTSTRIDKWLWAARCFKTRSLASAACNAGAVRINDETAKPSKTVKIGDEVDCRTPGGRRLLTVVAIAEKRGPVALAQSLFEDHSPVEPPRPPPAVRRERGAGRPTKRERRRMDRGSDWD